MAITGVSAIGAATATAVNRAPQAAASQATAGPSFEQMLGNVVNEAIGNVQNGEATAIQGVTGAAAPFKVVDAIMTAQRSLQQVVAIRDKAVAAYSEIAHMQI